MYYLYDANGPRLQETHCTRISMMLLKSKPRHAPYQVTELFAYYWQQYNTNWGTNLSMRSFALGLADIV